jgi:hypothetical protein
MHLFNTDCIQQSIKNNLTVIHRKCFFFCISDGGEKRVTGEEGGKPCIRYAQIYPQKLFGVNTSVGHVLPC